MTIKTATKNPYKMKKTIIHWALFFCIISFAIGTISCESKEQKEARAKAQAEQQKVEAERQRAREQIKTETGLQQYLVGKTFAYSGSTNTHWLKVTFVDKNTAVVYDASPRDRGWGEGERCTIQYIEQTDDYGKKNGKFVIKLESSEKYSLKIWSFKPSFYSDFCLTTALQVWELGLYRGVTSVTLSIVNANYYPEEWRD